jgi:hypothetical protein
MENKLQTLVCVVVAGMCPSKTTLTYCGMNEFNNIDI